MIIRENRIKLDKVDTKYALNYEGNNTIFKDALYFDLEHCVYKVPICVGVFGCCYYDEKENAVVTTQYMIEGKNDIREILVMAKAYFLKMYNVHNKRYIVTFSGNNDFSVINALLLKYKVNINIRELFREVDLQVEFKKSTDTCIGLKNLENIFGIHREGEVISGTNLAKTFSKIVKDPFYYSRMPVEKKEKILIYNEQDVVNLVKINLLWNKTMPTCIQEIKKEKFEAEQKRKLEEKSKANSE